MGLHTYQLNKKEYIHLIGLKRYDTVQSTLTILGYAPDSWFPKKSDKSAINFELLDIDGHLFFSGGATLHSKEPALPHLPKQKHFTWTLDVSSGIFTSSCLGWIEESDGRIAIRFNDFFLPIVVSGFKQEKELSPEKVKKNKTIEARVRRYERERREYPKRLSLIGEKYKEFLSWSDPLCKGLADKLNGFEFRVYSNDHDRHFHIINKERGIHARFSFPEITLINYKQARTTINSRQTKNIQKFFQDSNNLKKLENEFKKRDGY